MTSARVGDVTIEFESTGEGQPLLLVMGLASQLIHWPDEFVTELADRGFHVIRFDNRDIGLSTKMAGRPPGLGRTIASMMSRKLAKSDYVLADMANDAAGLLDHLGIGAAHVVGVSMGGMIAQSLAIAHPAKVASLTSIMSNTGDRKHGRVAVSLLSRMPKYLKSSPETMMANALALNRLVAGDEFDEARAREMIQRAFERDYDPRGTARQTAAIAASPDRTAALRNVTAPTLVIHGLADKLVQPSGGIATARAVPGSRLLMFPGMAHDLPHTRWTEVIDAIVTNTARATRAPIAARAAGA
ncbi:MAG: alpha/beta hydrolase [Ilumatobacteraceae bacterium]